MPGVPWPGCGHVLSGSWRSGLLVLTLHPVCSLWTQLTENEDYADGDMAHLGQWPSPRLRGPGKCSLGECSQNQAAAPGTLSLALSECLLSPLRIECLWMSRRGPGKPPQQGLGTRGRFAGPPDGLLSPDRSSSAGGPPASGPLMGHTPLTSLAHFLDRN